MRYHVDIMYQKVSAKFNTISFTGVLVLCLILPFFFLPGTWSGLSAVKGIVLYGGVFVTFSCWLVAQFVDGSLKLPTHRIFATLGIWVVLAGVSALASSNVSVSLWGRGFAVDSFATVAVLALFTFLIASFAREQKNLVKIFLVTFAGSVLTVFLQVALYLARNTPFVSKYLAHVASQGTLVGTWVDFAYVVTSTFLLSLLMYEVLSPKGFFKKLSLAAVILSILVLVFLNFKIAWMVTIISALLVFVYTSSVERSVARFFPQLSAADEDSTNTRAGTRFPHVSFAALLVGLFFFLSSGSIGTAISSRAGITFTDIRPSFESTVQVARAALWHEPVFGVGAGRYSNAWNLYHPLEVNQTQFWNTTFESGFNTLGTILTTNGILPTGALLVLLILSILHGFRLFTASFPDRFSRFIAVASLIMLVSFVLLLVVAAPGMVLIAFGFLYLGLLLGVSALIGRIQVRSINYLRDPRLSFFVILLLVLATMLGLAALYCSANRFASIVWYNRALIAPDTHQAQARLDRAVSLSQNDIYWRTRAALFTKQISDATRTSSVDKAALQTYFTQAEQSAQAAVSWDTTDAANWLNLSQVYQLVAGTSNTDAYNNAKQAADEARKRNPLNPAYVLNEAQLAIIHRDTTAALDYINQSLALKPTYIDAFVLRAQIRAFLGEPNAPKEELTAYLALAPYDAQGYLLLGQANLAAKDYQAALTAYTRAAQLAPLDLSARLSMINTMLLMGNKEQAIDALAVLKAQFPTVHGIDEKIAELQAEQATSEIQPIETGTNTTKSKTKTN